MKRKSKKQKTTCGNFDTCETAFIIIIIYKPTSTETEKERITLCRVTKLPINGKIITSVVRMKLKNLNAKLIFEFSKCWDNRCISVQ